MSTSIGAAAGGDKTRAVELLLVTWIEFTISPDVRPTEILASDPS